MTLAFSLQIPLKLYCGSFTRKLMARILQRHGHIVATAENGGDALTLLKNDLLSHEVEQKFDIVFLDK